ncbi:MAG TPA: stage V sporulation protein S [Patescibacteria group bacterium]
MLEKEPDKKLSVIKVSATSRHTVTAMVIQDAVKMGMPTEVQTIGASACNQGIKSIALTRRLLEEKDIHIGCVPHFVKIEVDGQERTAVRFSVVRAKLESKVDESEDSILKISAMSRATAVAGALTKAIKKNKIAVVQSLGSSATYQAVKGLALGAEYLKKDGIEIVSFPIFRDFDLDGMQRTAVRFIVANTDSVVKDFSSGNE